MFDESGGDERRRRDETRRLLTIIKEADVARFSQREIDFVHQMTDRFEQYGDRTQVSPKQLFWLRDIKDRSL